MGRFWIGLGRWEAGRVPPAAWLALLLVFGAVYARCLGHGFVWDDFSNVVDRSHFEAPLLSSLLATQHDFMDRSLLHSAKIPVPYESYRPLLFLSYFLDDALFERGAAAMHAHNLLIAMLCVLLAGWVCTQMLGDARLGFASAALFALHPLQTEAVCYVSARGDLLCMLFALLSSGAFLRAVAADGRRERAALTALAAVSYALSLGSKEAAALLPVGLAIWALALGRLGSARVPLLALVGTACTYAGLRLTLLGAELGVVDGGNTADALWSLPGLGLEYLRVFFVPNDLSIERLAPGGAVDVLGWLLLAGVACLGALALRDRLADWNETVRQVCAGLAWFYAMLAPSTLAVESMGVAADRYASLPILGACVAIVALVARAGRAAKVRFPVPAAAAWAVTLVLVSAAQVSVWRDAEALYGNSLAVEPESSMAHYRLGVLRAQAQNWGEALAYFEDALALDPENIRALNNVGVAYLSFGRLEQAEAALVRTLHLSGEMNFRAWNNLATLRFAQHRVEHACAALQRALGINPDYAVARDNHERNCAAEAG